MSSHNVLGIIGGGQLGSMLCQAAKNLDIKTVIYCNDKTLQLKIIQTILYMQNMITSQKSMNLLIK